MVRPRLRYFLAVFCVCAFSVLPCLAQSQVDSLKLLLKSAGHDTNRLAILNLLADIGPEGEWEKYNEELGNESEKLLKSNDPKVKRTALRYKANFINNNGYVAYQHGDIPKALESYHASLKIHEQIKSTTAIPLAYNNIGFVYSGQGNMAMALYYYQKSLEGYTRLDNKEGIALSLNNIGHMYDLEAVQLTDKKAPPDSILPKLQLALSYYKRSLRMHEEIKEPYGLANSLNNIGAVYAPMMEQWKKKGIKQDSMSWYAQQSLECHLRSLQIKKEIGDQVGEAQSYSNLGWHYFRAGEYAKAEEYAKRSLEMGRKLGFPGSVRDASKLMFQLYKAEGKYKEALEMHEQFISMRDSIQNEKNNKLGIQRQIQYEYDKKAAADSVRVAEEKKVVAIQRENDRKQKVLLYSVLALMILVAIFIFTRLRITQRQKRIIEKQKHEVEEQKDIIAHQKGLVDEKQKEIVDSINYAKRLQQAILPPSSHIDGHIENFVLYKPKDIVAGDFYWMFEENGEILMAAADSTGHGVPGAMVSIVCSNALDKAVKEFGLREPGRILDKATDLILETFARSGEEIKDGMDISLLYLDKKNKKIRWAGAHNQLWYVTEAGEERIREITANKQPVGKSDHRVPFTTHTIDWVDGAMYYLITDGFPDQFGGPKGKKFKTRQLETLILSVASQPVNEQKEKLEKAFNDWKGSLEQVDDVTIIGIRV